MGKGLIGIVIVIGILAILVAMGGLFKPGQVTQETERETVPPITTIILPEETTPTENPPQTTQTEIPAATVEAKEFTIEGDEFSFNPASITVNKGDRVKITFKNVGGTIHNLVISELGVSIRTISPGASDSIEFTADKSGTFSFYCSISGHRAAGMEGKLKVE